MNGKSVYFWFSQWTPSWLIYCNPNRKEGNYCKAFCFVFNNLVVKGFITQFAARYFITNNVYLFIEGPVVRLYFDVLRKTSFRDFNEHFNVHGLHLTRSSTLTYEHMMSMCFVWAWHYFWLVQEAWLETLNAAVFSECSNMENPSKVVFSYLKQL